MSCLLFWCCRGQQSDSDTENKAIEGLKRDGGEKKKKKTRRIRKRKGQRKNEKTKELERAEESQAIQQPAAGQKDSDVPHVPAGLVSGSLDNISAGILEKMETPLHEDFQTSEVVPEASSDLKENLLDQTEAVAEAKAIKPLMCTTLKEEEADNNQPLENEKLKIMAAETEDEAIQQIMNIYMDETEDTMEKHLGKDVEMMFDYTPIKSWADFMEETEGAINQAAGDETFDVILTEAEVEAVKDLMLFFVNTIEAELLGCEVISTANSEPGASRLNTQTHQDETDTPTDQPLAGDEMLEVMVTESEAEVIKDLGLTDLQETETENLDGEKKSDPETDWTTIKSLVADLLNDVERTVVQSLGKDVEMMFEYTPIKSWADFMEETEGAINQAGDETFDVILTDAEVEAVKDLMLFFVNTIEADLQGCEVMSTANSEPGASRLNTQTHQDETDTPTDQPLGKDVEMMFDYTPIKSWADFMEGTERTINQVAEIEVLKKESPVNDTKTNEQKRNTRRGTRGKGRRITYKRDQEERKSEADKEKNSTRTSTHRAIQVGAVGQWKHQQRHEQTRTQPENSGTCERAPDTNHQQRRVQRKENGREMRYWTVEHLQKNLQAPPNEKSAPQRESRKNAECLRVRTAEIVQKTHLRPVNKQRDRETHSIGHRMDEHGWRGAAQCWHRESKFQRRDAPQTPSHKEGHKNDRGSRGYPAQCTPARTERSERTIRKPYWWQHNDVSVDHDERDTRERHQTKTYRNRNRQWKSERPTNASH